MSRGATAPVEQQDIESLERSLERISEQLEVLIAIVKNIRVTILHKK